MNEGNSFIVDIDNWFSNDPRLNEYLKTHDSISVRKEFIDNDNGERIQGVFTFYKDRRNCICYKDHRNRMWTLTVENDEPLTMEFERKENE